MKLTKTKLKRIIKEELKSLLNELNTNLYKVVTKYADAPEEGSINIPKAKWNNDCMPENEAKMELQYRNTSWPKIEKPGSAIAVGPSLPGVELLHAMVECPPPGKNL